MTKAVLVKLNLWLWNYELYTIKYVWKSVKVNHKFYQYTKSLDTLSDNIVRIEGMILLS